ncbi:hypothetical protein [Spongiactinospora sp. TRM90649]|uniref:hypothetical protein n=1 Tax=Spongiactinospora sp. TRM90649 TaxID=3031114 RepID=UPI0023F8AC4F|nr:hypothetical protein [Spongiactinospora sp. TRM90649]MDF5753285.1 hypothetical protein [Spongiactinospora sp. TRM90649]
MLTYVACPDPSMELPARPVHVDGAAAPGRTDPAITRGELSVTRVTLSVWAALPRNRLKEMAKQTA